MRLSISTDEYDIELEGELSELDKCLGKPVSNVIAYLLHLPLGEKAKVGPDAVGLVDLSAKPKALLISYQPPGSPCVSPHLLLQLNHVLVDAGCTVYEVSTTSLNQSLRRPVDYDYMVVVQSQSEYVQLFDNKKRAKYEPKISELYSQLKGIL